MNIRPRQATPDKGSIDFLAAQLEQRVGCQGLAIAQEPGRPDAYIVLPKLVAEDILEALR
jgi:hypothetical protein